MGTAFCELTAEAGGLGEAMLKLADSWDGRGIPECLE